MRDFKLKHIAVCFSFILLACQDTDLETESPVDQDMEDALALAEDFLSSSRTEIIDSDVTVIRYQSDLVYKTNSIQGGYEPINEETITAESMPGGYIFWNRGGGVAALVQIEMDSASQASLGVYEPFEVIKGQMWALWIPKDLDDDIETLKYDIIYKNISGDIIRLDPKIQIKNEE